MIKFSVQPQRYTYKVSVSRGTWGENVLRVFETQNIALDLAIFGEHMIVLLCFLRITNVNFPLIISACYSASGFTADVLPNFPDLGHAHGNTAEGSHVV